MTNEITYQVNSKIPFDKILNLYNDAGWLAYTQKPEILKKAFENSLLVISAWEGEQLLGLIRLVGDGFTIIYIQDILVLEAQQRKGIGKQLIVKALTTYPNVRQTVLMTDDTIKTRAFYQSCGFNSCDDGRSIAFAQFK